MKSETDKNRGKAAESRELSAKECAKELRENATSDDTRQASEL